MSPTVSVLVRNRDFRNLFLAELVVFGAPNTGVVTNDVAAQEMGWWSD